jgi:hypothetical protein
LIFSGFDIYLIFEKRLRDVERAVTSLEPRVNKSIKNKDNKVTNVQTEWMKQGNVSTLI